MADFNCCVVVGTVRFGPVYQERAGKTPYAKMLVSIQGHGKDGPVFVTFDVRAYGKNASDVMRNVRTRDRILVEGPVAPSAFMRNGEPVGVLYLTLKKWMPDPHETEVENVEKRLLGKGAKESDKGYSEGYGDNNEMLF